MPEHEPQVGQADTSIAATSSSLMLSSAASIIASTKSSLRTVLPALSSLLWLLPTVLAITLPASIGPPDTNTVGMFRRMAAISIPGVILSQFEIQTSASAQWALTMYSTESAIKSRLGNEYSIPL